MEKKLLINAAIGRELMGYCKKILNFKIEFEPGIKTLLSSMLVLSILYVLFFSMSVHCTQVTSFKIAVFHMTPHIEEDFSLVYDPKFAIPLRLYLTISLLCFLFYPSIMDFLLVSSKIKTRTFLFWGFLISLIHVINTFLPEKIIGERFQALNLYSLFFIFLISIPFGIYIVFKSEILTKIFMDWQIHKAGVKKITIIVFFASAKAVFIFLLTNHLHANRLTKHVYV